MSDKKKIKPKFIVCSSKMIGDPGDFVTPECAGEGDIFRGTVHENMGLAESEARKQAASAPNTTVRIFELMQTIRSELPIKVIKE